MHLVEESCAAQSEGDSRMALSKAKEASSKERSLIRMQEQNGLGEHHNIDLTYAVSIFLSLVIGIKIPVLCLRYCLILQINMP